MWLQCVEFNKTVRRVGFPSARWIRDVAEEVLFRVIENPRDMMLETRYDVEPVIHDARFYAYFSVLYWIRKRKISYLNNSNAKC